MAAALIQLPLALGGESGGHENVGLAVVSLVSIVLGYLLIAGLWWFVFRPGARRRRRKPPRSD